MSRPALKLVTQEAPRYQGKAPPHQLEAERALLGHLLGHPGDLAAVADIVRPADFFADHHQLIARALFDVLGDGEAPPETEAAADALVTEVLVRLHQRGQLQRVSSGQGATGAKALLLSLTMEPSIASRLVPVARIVRDHARLRRLLVVLWEGVGELYDGAIEDPSSWLAGYCARVAEHGHREDDEPQGLEEGSGAAAASYRTGLSELDNDGLGRPLFRLRAPEVTLVTAKEGGGKSAFAMGVGFDVANAADPDGQLRNGVLCVSIEMPREQVRERLLAREARVTVEALRERRELDLDVQARIDEAERLLERVPFRVYDRKAVHAAQIVSVALRSKRRLEQQGKRLALVIVDYFQLLDDEPHFDAREGRHRSLDRQGKRLVRMAAELGVPVMIVAQLNDQGLIADCRAMQKHAHNWLEPVLGKASSETRSGSVPSSIKIRKGRDRKARSKVPTWFTGKHYLFSDEEPDA